MPLEISPVHRKDLESCTRLRYTGFRKDAMVQALYGGGETEEMISYSINEARKKFGEDPNERSVKVKDSETGEIIAYSLWKYNNDRTALENWDQMPEITDSPPGWDKELMLKIEHEQAVSMNKYMGQKAFLYVVSVVTHPDHLRRGAGSLIMKWGISYARSLNVPVFLMASPHGVPLYIKHGFQIVGETAIDLPTALIARRQVIVCMKYPIPDPGIPSKVPDPSWNIEVSLLDYSSVEDFIRTAEIMTAAFEDDRISALLFNKPKGQDDTEGMERERSRQVERAEKSRDSAVNTKGRKFTKAVDTLTGEIIAVGKWVLFDEGVEKEQLGWWNGSPGANVELLEFFFGSMAEKRESHMQGVKKYWYMSVLATEPKHHRRGIASKLLKWGLDQADAEGLPVWIDATPKGLPLYIRHGWKEVDHIDIHAGKYGGEEGAVYRTVCMLREPQTPK